VEPHYYILFKKKATLASGSVLVYAYLLYEILGMRKKLGSPYLKAEVVIALCSICEYALNALMSLFQRAIIADSVVRALVRTALAVIITMCNEVNKHRSNLL
jgi:hypothetical protein